MSKELKDLRCLLVHEMQDLYSAETQLVKALPEVIKKAHCTELQGAISSHLEETKGHVARLVDALTGLDAKTDGAKCKAMQGLIKETDDTSSHKAPEDVMDAALIACANRVEHYEIAAYGTVVSFARQLGLENVAQAMQQTLEEEKAADQKLTEIAEGHINERAQMGGGLSKGRLADERADDARSRQRGADRTQARPTESEEYQEGSSRQADPGMSGADRRTPADKTSKRNVR